MSPAAGIDLRSDTVTKPSPEMRRAMAEAVVGDDVFMEDPTLGALQNRILFPFLLFGLSGATLRLLSLSQWYLLLRLLTASVGLGLFFLSLRKLARVDERASQMALLLMAAEMIVTFSDPWEHPNDFLDLGLTSLMIGLALTGQRLATMANLILMSFNQESSVFAGVVWFALYGVRDRKLIPKETFFAAVCVTVALITVQTIRWAFGGAEALHYSRLTEALQFPSRLSASVMAGLHNPITGWPGLLAAAICMPLVVGAAGGPISERAKRLLMASIVMCVAVILAGIVSELRDFLSAMIVWVFVAVLPGEPATGAGSNQTQN